MLMNKNLSIRLELIILTALRISNQEKLNISGIRNSFYQNLSIIQLSKCNVLKLWYELLVIVLYVFPNINVK